MGIAPEGTHVDGARGCMQVLTTTPSPPHRYACGQCSRRMTAPRMQRPRWPSLPLPTPSRCARTLPEAACKCSPRRPPSPQVRPNSARGASLHAGAGCACGDTLLSIPLAACVLASEVPESEWAAVVARVQALGGLEKASDEASVAVREDGRLFVALLRLLDTSARHDANSPSADTCLRARDGAHEAPARVPDARHDARHDARAAYFARLAPRERLEASMLAAWEEGSAAARLLRHCVAWHRARAWRRRVEAERLAVLSALGLSPVH